MKNRMEMQLNHRAMVAWGGLGLSVFLVAGMLLWLRFGETVYVDRLLSAVANCF